MSKTFKIIDNDISDGYHTFDELYEHRIALFLYAIRFGAFKDAVVVENHFEGWDLIFAYLKNSGRQISYHVPIVNRYLYSHLERRHDEWDGHTSGLVISALNTERKGEETEHD